MSTVPTQGQATQVPTFVTADELIDYDSFITEDDTPVDSWYCERQLRLLTDVLHASWRGPGANRPRCVATDVGLFYSTAEPAVAPDVMISLDVAPPQDWAKKKNRSYFMWLMGKAPEMAVEVVSNLEGGELTTKMELYARIGVMYYIVWDPMKFLSDTPLHCFVLNRKKYVPCESWFPELELGVIVWTGEYDGICGEWMRWCDRQGQLLPTGVERAETAEGRADSLEERAVKLAEKLRSLGVDHDQA